jgi:hypothetical protein
MRPNGDEVNSLVNLTWTSELHPHFVVLFKKYTDINRCITIQKEIMPPN